MEAGGSWLSWLPEVLGENAGQRRDEHGSLKVQPSLKKSSREPEQGLVKEEVSVRGSLCGYAHVCKASVHSWKGAGPESVRNALPTPASTSVRTGGSHPHPSCHLKGRAHLLWEPSSAP